MPGEPVPHRKEPIRGFKPLVMAAFGSLLLSGCTGPIFDAIERVKVAQVTAYTPDSTCPTKDGPISGGTLKLVENTGDFKIDNLKLKGPSYKNGYYTLCFVEDPSKAILVDKNGAVLGFLKVDDIGSIWKDNVEMFKKTVGGYEEVAAISEHFFEILGYFQSIDISNQNIAPSISKQNDAAKSNDTVKTVTANPTSSLEFGLNEVIIYSTVAILLLAVLKRITSKLKHKNPSPVVNIEESSGIRQVTQPVRHPPSNLNTISPAQRKKPIDDKDNVSLMD